MFSVPWQLTGSSLFFLFLFFFFFFLILFIYLHFWLRWVFGAARGLSLVAASRAPFQRQCTGFSCYRAQTQVMLGLQLIWGMWNLPGPGMEPVSPALIGRRILNPWTSREVWSSCSFGKTAKFSLVFITAPQSYRGSWIALQTNAISYHVTEVFSLQVYKFSSSPNCFWAPWKEQLKSPPRQAYFKTKLMIFVLGLFLPSFFRNFASSSFLSVSPGFPLAPGYRYVYSTFYSTLLTYLKKLSHLLISCHHQIYGKSSTCLLPLVPLHSLW